MEKQHETLLIPIINREVKYADICEYILESETGYTIYEKPFHCGCKLKPQQLIIFDNKEITFGDVFEYNKRLFKCDEISDGLLIDNSHLTSSFEEKSCRKVIAAYPYENKIFENTVFELNINFICDFVLAGCPKIINLDYEPKSKMLKNLFGNQVPAGLMDSDYKKMKELLKADDERLNNLIKDLNLDGKNNVNKPKLVEVFADNGEHSHWTLIDPVNGEKLWSENPEECAAMGYPVKKNRKTLKLNKTMEWKEIKSSNNLPKEEEHEEHDWTIPDEDGNINVPDELMPLFNSIGFQFRFHTISGENEILCIARATKRAQEFFDKKYLNNNNSVNNSLSLAVEYGYKSCEKGNNLDKTLIEFNKLKH